MDNSRTLGLPPSKCAPARKSAHGGDKRRQSFDIDRAVEYLQDYKERTRKP